MKQLNFRVINKYSGLFKIIFSISLVLLLWNSQGLSTNATNDSLQAHNELDVLRRENNSNWLLFSDAPNSLYHHLAGQAYDLLDKRAGIIAELRSLSDWQQRQKWLRETLMDIVGPFPEKSPLNAKILRVIDKDDYRVEHIVYESQPGFYVTSSMFIPDGLIGKAPAVIYCSGHSNEGYRSTAYQHVILNLVKKGFIVFAFDPVASEYWTSGC